MFCHPDQSEERTAWREHVVRLTASFRLANYVFPRLHSCLVSLGMTDKANGPHSPCEKRPSGLRGFLKFLTILFPFPIREGWRGTSRGRSLLITRTLGKIGLRVSEIGFGGWAIGGDVNGYIQGGYGPTNDDESRAAIRQALELGVTFFDTADIYGNGHGEALLGEVIDQWPDKQNVVIATKGGINFYREGEAPELDFTPYAIANAVQHSLARLRREVLDLYMLMTPPVELLTEKPHVRESLLALQRAGKIGAFGVSPATIEDAVDLLRSDFPLDAIEVTFNLLDQGAIREVLPLAKRRKVAVIAREPLANGLLTGKYNAETRFDETDHRSGMSPEYRGAVAEVVGELGNVLVNPARTLPQAALRFVLDEPGVTVAIPGAKTAAQVRENVGAVYTPPITDSERIAIHKVFFPGD